MKNVKVRSCWSLGAFVERGEDEAGSHTSRLQVHTQPVVTEMTVHRQIGLPGPGVIQVRGLEGREILRIQPRRKEPYRIGVPVLDLQPDRLDLFGVELGAEHLAALFGAEDGRRDPDVSLLLTLTPLQIRRRIPRNRLDRRATGDRQQPECCQDYPMRLRSPPSGAVTDHCHKGMSHLMFSISTKDTGSADTCKTARTPSA